MRTSNPILNRININNEGYAIDSMPMTYSGTMTKLLLLGLIMAASAGVVAYKFFLNHFDAINIIVWISFIVGLILSLIISFKPKCAPMLSPFYALCEGALLSAISCVYETSYSGIVLNAGLITIGTVVVMALLFKARIIQATQKFKMFVLIAGASITLFYLISSIAIFFFNANITYFTDNYSLPMFLLNLVIVVVASLYLILDFDFIVKGVENRFPSYYEWYGAFGLLITIVWMYLEILRLLARLRNR